jgi:hypothetical protein
VIGIEGEEVGAVPRVLIQCETGTYNGPSAWLGGERLACLTLAEGTANLVLVSAADGSVTVLRRLPKQRVSFYTRFAAASPDGRFLAYNVQQGTTDLKTSASLRPTAAATSH